MRSTCKACTKPMCHGYLDNASWFFVIQFQDFMLVVPKFPEEKNSCFSKALFIPDFFRNWLKHMFELEEIRGKKSTTPLELEEEEKRSVFTGYDASGGSLGKMNVCRRHLYFCPLHFFQLLFFALPFDNKISH